MKSKTSKAIIISCEGCKLILAEIDYPTACPDCKKKITLRLRDERKTFARLCGVCGYPLKNRIIHDKRNNTFYCSVECVMQDEVGRRK